MTDWWWGIALLAVVGITVRYALSLLEEIRKELTAIKHILEGRK